MIDGSGVIADIDMHADINAFELSDAGYVQEINSYLTQQESAAVYAILQHREIPSSLFYISVAELNSVDTPAPLARYFPPALTEFIQKHLHHLLDYLPERARNDVHGFELWTTTAKINKNENCYLHIDNDEKLRISTGEIRTPMLGSILYVGPQNGLIGGETLFVMDESVGSSFESFTAHDWNVLTALGSSIRVVGHQAGKLVLFSGQTRHGQGPVVDFCEGNPRVAFLVNMWNSRIGDVPEGMCRISPEEFTKKIES